MLCKLPVVTALLQNGPASFWRCHKEGQVMAQVSKPMNGLYYARATFRFFSGHWLLGPTWHSWDRMPQPKRANSQQQTSKNRIVRTLKVSFLFVKMKLSKVCFKLVKMKLSKCVSSSWKWNLSSSWKWNFRSVFKLVKMKLSKCVFCLWKWNFRSVFQARENETFQARENETFEVCSSSWKWNFQGVFHARKNETFIACSMLVKMKLSKRVSCLWKRNFQSVFHACKN